MPGTRPAARGRDQQTPRARPSHRSKPLHPHTGPRRRARTPPHRRRRGRKRSRYTDVSPQQAKTDSLPHGRLSHPCAECHGWSRPPARRPTSSRPHGARSFCCVHGGRPIARAVITHAKGAGAQCSEDWRGPTETPRRKGETERPGALLARLAALRACAAIVWFSRLFFGWSPDFQK